MTDIKSTYAAFAEAFLDEAGGRFKAVNETIHTATTPTYPELPENSPSHHDPVPDEPPLGFSIEDHPPVGTYKEVQRSIKKLGGISALDGPPDDGAVAALASSSAASLVDAVCETAAPFSTSNDDDDREPPPRAA